MEDKFLKHIANKIKQADLEGVGDADMLNDQWQELMPKVKKSNFYAKYLTKPMIVSSVATVVVVSLGAIWFYAASPKPSLKPSKIIVDTLTTSPDTVSHNDVTPGVPKEEKEPLPINSQEKDTMSPNMPQHSQGQDTVDEVPVPVSKLEEPVEKPSIAIKDSVKEVLESLPKEEPIVPKASKIRYKLLKDTVQVLKKRRSK